LAIQQDIRGVDPRVNAEFVIVGSGLGGALLACFLGKAGHTVDVYEMRDDLRTTEIVGGRSINLALSYRGLCALEKIGLADEVLKTAVPMRGRMIHSRTGETAFQPYGVDDSQAINSVSRGGLNVILLSAAAKYPNVRLFFNEKCTDADADTGRLDFTNTKTGQHTNVEAKTILSVDGAFSAVRRALQKRERFDYSQTYLEHGYKELTIPAAPGGGFRLEKNALHIWPRKSFMMIALPNADGSFTVTLFWPFEGENSFAAIRDEADLLSFFTAQFPDAVPLMPELVVDYFHNPTGSMVTIRCSPWHIFSRVCLLGDAAHAVVPFYGQGMNAAFEDVLVLSECMERSKNDLKAAFADYERIRKPDVDALAELAVGNFVEMRDKTGSRLFRWKKKYEKLLAKALPGRFIPLYVMVTFTRIPYAQAVRRAKRQNRIVILAVSVFVTLIFAAWMLAT
jgi:kynurenine 3-monooxygenase